MKFTPVIAYMEYCGAKLDPVKWKQKMIRDKGKLIKQKLNLTNGLKIIIMNINLPGYVKPAQRKWTLCENQLFDKVGPHMGQIKGL